MARITRRLKVYTTRIGIRDWVVAAANRKEALKAWDVRENLFASGTARETSDPTAVELALKSPGVPVALPGKLELPGEPGEPGEPVARGSTRHASRREGKDARAAGRAAAEVIRLDEHRRKRVGPNVVDLDSRRREKQRAEDERKGEGKRTLGRDGEREGAARPRGKSRRKGRADDRQPMLPLSAPPPPDRSRLDAAEEALAAYEIESKERRRELEKKRRALELELEAFESEARRHRERLEKRVENERTAFAAEQDRR